MSCSNFDGPVVFPSLGNVFDGLGSDVDFGSLGGDTAPMDDGSFSGDFSLPDRPQDDGTFGGDFSLPDRPTQDDGTFGGDFSLPDRPTQDDGTFGGDFSLPDRPTQDDGTFGGDFSLPDRPTQDDNVFSAGGGFDVRPDRPSIAVSGDSGPALTRPVKWTDPEVSQHLGNMKESFGKGVAFDVDPVNNQFGDVTTSFTSADGSSGGGSIVFNQPTFSGRDAPLEELLESVGLPPLPSLDDNISNREKDEILNKLLGLLDVASKPWMTPDAPALAAAAIQFGMGDWDESALNLLEGVGTMGKIMADIVRPLGGGKVLNWLDGLIPDRIKDEVLDVVEEGLGWASAVDPTKITSLVQAGIQLGRKDWDKALHTLLTLGLGKVTDVVLKPLKPLMKAKLDKLVKKT